MTNVLYYRMWVEVHRDSAIDALMYCSNKLCNGYSNDSLYQMLENCFSIISRGQIDILHYTQQA